MQTPLDEPMKEPGESPRSSRSPRVQAIVWAVALGLAGWAVNRIGVDVLLAPWRRVAVLPLAAAVVLQCLSYLARAARLAQSEPEIGWAHFAPCLRLVLIHNSTNLLLPMRSGELSFPWLMRRWFGVDPVRAGGTLLFLRVADVQVLACGGLIAGLLLAQPGSPVRWLGLTGALAFGAPVALFVFARVARRHTVPWPLVRRLSTGVPDTWRGYLAGLAWTWVGWAVKLAGLGLLFAALAQTSVPLGVFAALGGDVSSVLPIHAPGGIGTYEAGAVAALAPWRAIDADLVAAIVALHSFVLAVALGLGGIAALPGWRNPSLAADR